jgi:transcriptional regulator with GAF, ATPase, and Fis domain
MERVVEAIRLIGPRRCTVLLTGETGTGKELVARALHQASPRAGQPLVAVNCSALPEQLLEAELFGHVRGAFTGAINARVGRFEQAHRGTLFLDEIADMPMELQVKLLRVLQDREIQRLGSGETVAVDVRVIAASNVDLLERVRQGKFREDLYYRLNVVPLVVPPLRQRESDIPRLVEHFIGKVCQLEGIPEKSLGPETLARLRAFEWPGNVRQLENAVEMAVVMSGDRQTLHAADFGLPHPAAARVIPFETPAQPVDDSAWVDFETAVSQFERSILERALARTSGNKTAAAQLLGMKRTTLIMKLRSFRSSGAVLVS